MQLTTPSGQICNIRKKYHLVAKFKFKVAPSGGQICASGLDGSHFLTIFCVQACPDGFAVYGMQARFLTTVDSCLPLKPPNPAYRGACLSPKDGAGITGLRLFCSTVTDVIVQPHKRTKKTLEFPGSIGDWGEKLACNAGQWATTFEIRFAEDSHAFSVSWLGGDLGVSVGGVPIPTFGSPDTELIPLGRLGVVQMGLRCKSNPLEKEETSEGIVTPYGQKSGRIGTLQTKDPTLWQHGLIEEELKDSEIARQCQKSFIMGAKVQTDQNDRRLGVFPEGRNPDMVGINNVKLACDIYGKGLFTYYVSQIWVFPDPSLSPRHPSTSFGSTPSPLRQHLPISLTNTF